MLLFCAELHFYQTQLIITPYDIRSYSHSNATLEFCFASLCLDDVLWPIRITKFIYLISFHVQNENQHHFRSVVCSRKAGMTTPNWLLHQQGEEKPTDIIFYVYLRFVCVRVCVRFRAPYKMRRTRKKKICGLLVT